MVLNWWTNRATLNSSEFENRIRKRASRPLLSKGVMNGVSHDEIQIASIYPNLIFFFSR